MRCKWPVFLLPAMQGARTISIGRVGTALVLGLHCTHHIHPEPDTPLKPLVPVQNFRCIFIRHFLASIRGKFM
jgi:hypothetical protein